MILGEKVTVLTLVGGAVVSVHSAGAYVSGDLDFVEDALVVR